MRMEFYRLLYNKKIICILISLVVLNIVLFFYQQFQFYTYSELIEAKNYRTEVYEQIEGMSDDEISTCLSEQSELADTATKQMVLTVVSAQLEYINTYSDYVDDVINSAERVLNFSIFNTDKSKYSTQNITNTVNAYNRINDVKLKMGNDAPIEQFLYYNYAFYISIIMMLIIVFTVIREYKQGLTQIIYASSGGRLKLAVKRLSFIGAASLIINAVNLMITFMLCVALYGGNINLSRAIQSVQLFKNFTYNISLIAFLARYFIITSFALIIISIFVWTVISLIKNVVVSLLFIATFFVVEYEFLEKITLQSNLRLFKCINIFEFINASDYTIKYYNLNFFGNAVNILLVIKLAMIIVFSAVIFVGILVFIKKPQVKILSINLVNRLMTNVRTILYKVQKIYNLVLSEFYKMFIINKGIIVLAIALIALSSLINVRNMKYTDTEKYVNSFYEEYSGKITDEVYEHIAYEHTRADEIYENYENQLELYNKGEITDNELASAEYRLKTANTIEEGLEIIEEEIERLNDINERLNIDSWLINNRAYNKLLGSAGYETQRMIIVICVLFIVLTISGSFKYEEKSQITFLLRSTPGGRIRLFKAKEICSICAVLIATLFIYVIHIVYTAEQYGMYGLLAPVQSISLLQSCQLKISILAYIIGIQIIRTVIYLVLTEIILCLSSVVDQKIIVIGASFIVIVPIILGRVSDVIFNKISYFDLLNFNSIISEHEDMALNLIKIIVLFLIFICIRCYSIKKWCGRCIE